jgi:hypothetical protein
MIDRRNISYDKKGVKGKRNNSNERKGITVTFQHSPINVKPFRKD